VTPFGLVETAANGLINSVLVEELFATIGVNPPTSPPADHERSESRRRFIFRGGRPRQWPLGFFASLRMIMFGFRALFYRSSIAPADYENICDWGRRVMGEEASRYTVEAFLQGVYAGDARRMSARLIFGSLFAPSQAAASQATATSQTVPAQTALVSGTKDEASKVLKSKRPKVKGTVSAPGGMGEVIYRLRHYLENEGVQFQFGETVVLSGTQARPQILATSAVAAGEILQNLNKDCADLLKNVEMLPLVTTTVVYRDPVPSSLRGFGCLFPPHENRAVLGVLMNNYIFSGRSQTGFSETWIMGGARGEERTPGLLNWSDDQVLDVIDQERISIFGVNKSEIIGYRVTRWPRALPHYSVELERKIEVITSKPMANVFFAGNWLGSIGLAKILERASHLPNEISNRGVWL
jgi:oxygen-dependent protoporphyrinogen oxidase